jgi:ATP-dependent RNA helicase RhlE
MPHELRKLALVLMQNPVEVAADQVASTPTAIEQVVYHVPTQQKRLMLEHLVRDVAITRALVFTRTKHGADRVARHLKASSIGADALHGGKTQAARERALAAFRDGSLRVLVATDLAARGIHVDGISHVINFDLPLDADNYVHRIGRTARAGASGKALSLCSSEERDVLRRIEKLIQRRLPVEQTPTLMPMVPPKTSGQAGRNADGMASAPFGGRDRGSDSSAPARGFRAEGPARNYSAPTPQRATGERVDLRPNAGKSNWERGSKLSTGRPWPRSRQPN